ncbi:hypothetical protein F5876DRAFT_81589 [Lentinula aff. lateritia]|uniref:Uncharacterized protein n=1 Tax=Lentinula aff. lateritia TaxID=2804960 RepID=A0ACC1TM98_9AGAR|nr:hypothetical protein F5876DRAFT_81589 [Lentinula aff. lateritia]
MSRSGYRPRQSIPSDVCNIPSCLNDEKGAEVNLGQDDPCQKEYSRTDSKVQAEHSNLSEVHAIDPACLRPMVSFDYACLEDLDEELILRPRSAFAEMCWSTAVQNIPRTTNQSQSLAQSLPFTSKCCQPCSALNQRPPSHSIHTPLNFKVSEGFFAADEGGQSECHSSSESDRSPSNTWHGSIEESSVMVVTGRLNVLENHDGVKLFEKKSIPGTVVVPSDSIIHVASTEYHGHDNAAGNDRLNIPSHCGDYSDNENSRMDFHDEEESNTDVGLCISIQDDDDVLLSQPHFPPALITHSVSHTDALLYSNLYSYGVTNPQESVGFFPIPVAGSRTTVNWEGRWGIKLSSRSRSFGTLGLISTAYGVPVANNVGLSHVDVTARNGNFPHVNYEFMNECQPRKIKLEKGLPEFKFPPHQPSLANVAVETVLAGFGTAGSALNDFVVWIWRTTKTILARRLILMSPRPFC